MHLYTLKHQHPALPEKELHNEKELLASISQGDEQAFKKLYDHYVPRLIPFLRKLTGSETPADEILQETFIRIWMSRDKLPGVEYPSTWIFEVASHVTFTWLKNKLRYEQVVSNFSASAHSPADNQPVEDHLHLLEARRLIQEAITLLPAQRKKIYLLSREQGLTIPAIAEATGLSPSTVKNTLVKALASIRKYLDEAGYHLPLFLLLNYTFKGII